MSYNLGHTQHSFTEMYDSLFEASDNKKLHAQAIKIAADALKKIDGLWGQSDSKEVGRALESLKNKLDEWMKGYKNLNINESVDLDEGSTEDAADQMYKEFIQFLEKVQKNIPTAIKDLKKGNISQTVSGLAHAMGGISMREKFYDYFFS